MNQSISAFDSAVYKPTNKSHQQSCYEPVKLDVELTVHYSKINNVPQLIHVFVLHFRYKMLSTEKLGCKFIFYVSEFMPDGNFSE